MTVQLRFAARSDVGLVRKGNEDSGYAGPHLLLIADGMGGHAFGEVASSAAVGVLVELEPGRRSTGNQVPARPPGPAPGPAPDYESDPAQGQAEHQANEQAEDLVVRVREQIARAGALLRTMIRQRPELEGMGTTVTALLQVDDRVVIAQVGDSRGYLLRGGVLEQLTHDQTYVQSLIDEGQISQDAARTHPQRALLLRALDGRIEVSAEISVRTPIVGDRYLLCSDGLSGVVSEATLREVLMVGSPDDAVDTLIDLALRGGAPDNVTCVVADVVEADPQEAGRDDGWSAPQLVGAAAEALAPPTVEQPVGAGGTAPGDGPDAGSGPHVFGMRLLLPVLLLVALVAAAAVGYHWTQQQYYVGASNGQVVIYRGVPQHIAGHRLSSAVASTGIALTALPEYYREQVDNTIPAGDLEQARQIVEHLRSQAATCTTYPEPAGCTPGLATSPSATPTSTPGSTPGPTPSKA